MKGTDERTAGGRSRGRPKAWDPSMGWGGEVPEGRRGDTGMEDTSSHSAGIMGLRETTAVP